MLALTSAVALLALTLPANGQDIQKGMDAAGSGDYATAMREWRPLAEAGDARLQALLGAIYQEGRRVPRDNVQAYLWLSRASLGHAAVSIAARVMIAAKMTRAEIDEARLLIREWRETQQ
jgi:TPR repeat protein